MTDPLLAVAPPPRALVETLPRPVDPLRALAAMRRRRHPALLLSGLDGHPEARWSILACDPLLVAELRGDAATLTWFEGDAADVPQAARRERRTVYDPFDLLRALAPAAAVERPPDGIPFAGGAIGYLGYGLRRAIERLPAAPPDPLGQPDAWFGLYDAAVVFDHRERRTLLVANGLGAGSEEERADRARRRVRALADLMSQAEGGPPAAPPEAAPKAAGRSRAVVPRERYLARVRRALDYIAAGDIYQVNLSHRLEAAFAGDPLDLFVRLARRNPAPFAAYLDPGPFQVVCASPERFVKLSGDRATSSPIKGTRPRGGDPASDRALAEALRRSPKDRAENVMIADLVRNDLGRVCAPGSVQAETLCALESFATVHHLVSTVTGRLRPDLDRLDLLRALFPGGSMTGAPKVRAMEIIDELEGEERGVYAGSIGYLSLDGRLDFNIVIRTIVCAGGTAHLRVGGAIVADSDPEAEYRETLDKARALLEALAVGMP